MKRPTLLGALLGVAAVALLFYSTRLQGRVVALRAERTTLAPAQGAPTKNEAAPTSAPASTQAPLTEAEKAELLRLRGQVQPLLRRQASLGVHSNEHAQLRARLDAVRQAAAPPPPGYVRRSEARSVGNATPENAFETFLWALEHRDTNVFMNCLSARAKQSMGRMLASTSAEEMFKNLPIPGGRILGQKQLTPDSLELSVEIVPGQTMPLPVRREGTGWVLAFE